MNMDKLVDSTQLDSDLTSIANAIRTKGGTSAQLAFPAGFVSAVNNIPSGGGTSVPSKDVDFIDYDGTIVYSYTAQEFLALSAMPANPSHDGLVAQGWNWTLQNAQAYVAEYGMHTIGQMYTTSDGKTRFYVRILEDGTSVTKDIGLQFVSSVADNVTIDWGDGNTETAGATSLTLYSHSYTAGGDYVIIVKVNSGTVTLQGVNASSNVLGSTSQYWPRIRLQKVEIGDGISEIGAYCFTYSCRLKKVSIPHGITEVGNYAFLGNNSLPALVIPDTVGSIGAGLFQTSAYGIEKISLPSGITILGSNAFNALYTLRRLVIPDTVTEIGQQAISVVSSMVKIVIPKNVTSIGSTNFNASPAIKEYHLHPTSPPALASTSVFSAITNDCIIYVPYSADHSILTAYQNETNWSTFASYMQEEPQS